MTWQWWCYVYDICPSFRVGIPSWVAGRKCCRSGCPWCFPVMVAVAATWVPVFRLYTSLKSRFQKGKLWPTIWACWIFYVTWLFLIFSISKQKTNSSFWMGFHTPLLGWVDTPWGSLTKSHVPNFPLRLGLGTWINRLVAQPKRRGLKGWIQRRGLRVPSSWHVTAYFLSSSQHSPVPHVFYPLVILIIFF